jgi:hypothetical protein
MHDRIYSLSRLMDTVVTVLWPLDEALYKDTVNVVGALEACMNAFA